MSVKSIRKGSCEKHGLLFFRVIFHLYNRTILKEELKMKKLFVGMVALAMVLGLGACGKRNTFLNVEKTAKETMAMYKTGCVMKDLAEHFGGQPNLEWCSD